MTIQKVITRAAKNKRGNPERWEKDYRGERHLKWSHKADSNEGEEEAGQIEGKGLWLEEEGRTTGRVYAGAVFCYTSKYITGADRVTLPRVRRCPH